MAPASRGSRAASTEPPRKTAPWPTSTVPTSSRSIRSSAALGTFALGRLRTKHPGLPVAVGEDALAYGLAAFVTR